MNNLYKMEQLLALKTWKEIMIFLSKYTISLLKYVVYTKQKLGYDYSNIINTGISLKSIIKVGSWISRPLIMPAMSVILDNCFEHHGLVTDITGDIITIIHFYGDIEKNNCVVSKISFEDFVADSKDNRFNIYYPENIDAESFEYYLTLNTIESALQIINNRLGNKDYNFFSNNCEKLVTDSLFTYRPRSFQSNRFLQFMNHIVMESYLGIHSNHDKVIEKIYNSSNIPFRKFRYEKNKTLTEFN